MLMNIWVSRAVRWMLLLAGYGALWGATQLFGMHGLTYVVAWDRALSAAINPDAYFPFVDEFFRAVTDYSEFTISVPLVSLAIAIGIYRFTQMNRAQAALWGGGLVALWWVVLFVVGRDEDLSSSVLIGLGLAPVLLLVLGAGPALLNPAFNTRRWIAGMLCVETLIVLGLWASRKLFWNEGLVGANFVFLPVLIASFGLMVYLFFSLGEDALRRYTRIFWLVTLSTVMVGLIATKITKESVARPRPLAESNKPWNEALRPIPEETLRGASSFPSGHTSGTFAMLTPVFWWTRSRRARAGLLGWGVLQGASRIYTVAHFTSDCIFGAMLGFGTGTLIFFLLGGPALRPPAPTEARA
jgi:membrane-associated phospholipid phosphatase